MRRALPALAAFAALAAPPCASAAGDSPIATGASASAGRNTTGATPALWHAQVDNDVAFGTDRWYTSGVKIYRSLPAESGAFLASFLRVPSARPYRIDVGIIHEIYTGDGIATAARADRPNAGRLLLSIARHDLAPDLLATWELDAGIAGPAARGRQVQSAIHHITPAPATDWASQASDRADVQLVGAWSRRFGPGMAPGAWVIHGGAVAGTLVAFGHAGIEWRSESPAQAPNPLLRFAATPPLPRTARGLSFHAGASVRAVARNRLLDRRGDDPLPDAARRRSVARLALGAAWYGDWGEVSLGLAQDSREFEGQQAPHRFGSLTVSFPID